MIFADLQQDYFHRIAIAPSERQPRAVEYSDIILHLPVLQYYASLCSHVTELGVRDGHSTVALLGGCKGKVVSYDIERSRVVDVLENMALPCQWQFRRGDTADPNLGVDETEFLFVDTLHTDEHVRKELALWGRKATRFIGFHDTFTCAEYDVSGANPNAKGILDAINDFVNGHAGEYRTVYRTDWNNGVWILQRVYPLGDTLTVVNPEDVRKFNVCL